MCENGGGGGGGGYKNPPPNRSLKLRVCVLVDIRISNFAIEYLCEKENVQETVFDFYVGLFYSL